MSPPSIESDLPRCDVCGEYLANHWRGRPCAAIETSLCFRCGADALIEVGAGYACLSCLMVGLHE
jgi:hypothetical protein